MKKGLILLIFIALLTVKGQGQYYETGQDPASLRWYQINTDHFRLIYPRDFTETARRYAIMLEESYNRLSVLYPSAEARVRLPVIIHNYSMESNGYVTWAPRRMELYPLPGQNNLPDDPASQLALHEAVHVAQLASLNKGVSRVLGLLLGEQMRAINAVLIPEWGYEGDAVYAETLLSPSGRGRSNAFTQGARALTASPGGIYSYDKMLLRSYRDYTPDHYVFGYLMMNHLRQNDPMAWNEAMDGAARLRGINPVNRSLKKNLGLTKKRLYDSTFAAVRRSWATMDEGFSHPAYETLSHAIRNDYVSHYMPHRTSDGRIVSLRTSFSLPQRFVITDSKDEKLLTNTGSIYPHIFSCNGETIVWSEMHTDPRWENLNYSVIKKMNVSDGNIVQLSHKSRFEAPAISPDGKVIAAVSTTPELDYSLVFIDASTGETMMTLASPDNIILQRPSWTSDGSGVTVITLSGNGEGIRTYYPTGKRWIIHRPEGRTDIIQAMVIGDTLYFLAQGDGSDNVYRTLPDGTTERVTGSRFGISGFSVSGNEMLISDYTAKGFRIVSLNLNSTEEGCNVDSPSAPVPAIAPMPEDQESVTNTPSLEEPRRYIKTAHLFNFHSWFPFYADLDQIQADPLTGISPGFTLLSQNHLSTMISSLGYEYYEKRHHFHSSIKWTGWYPVIEAGLNYGGERVVTKPAGVTALPADLSPALNLNIDITVPLWFRYGKYSQYFMPGIYVKHVNNYTYVGESQPFDENITLITGRLFFRNTLRMAWRDIYPRWGQVVDLSIVSAPWDTDLYGTLRYARGVLFFPGLLRNHSLMIRAGYETQQPTARLLYYNRSQYPRGYQDLISEKLFTLSVDYTMPLLYPDLSVDGFFYLKRLRASLFLDGATGTDVHDLSAGQFREGSHDFGSFGCELLADFNLLRIPFDISGGVSTGYIPSKSRFFATPVMSVNIYGTTLGRKR